MKNILIAIFIFSATLISAQIAPPPPQVEIKPEKKILVDELIKTTNFEKYVYNYCKSIILQYAKQNKWDDKKTQNIIENSNYKYFDQVLYFTFKDDSNEELKSLILAFKQINKKRNPENFLVPDNFQIQRELVQFTIKIIQGQFLLNK